MYRATVWCEIEFMCDFVGAPILYGQSASAPAADKFDLPTFGSTFPNSTYALWAANSCSKAWVMAVID